MARVAVDPSCNSGGIGDGLSHEVQRQLQSVVFFCTTKPQIPFSGLTKTFAAKAGHSKPIICTFKQVHRESVAGDSKSVADFGHSRKYIERAGRLQGLKAIYSIQPSCQ